MHISCRIVAAIVSMMFVGGVAAWAGDTAVAASASKPMTTPQAKLKLVSLQMNVSAKTKEERVTAALKLLEKAAEAEGPGVYVLPEFALTPLPNPAASQEPVPGSMTKRFSEVAARRGLWVAVGISETSPDPQRPYNGIAIMGPQGQIYRYHKTHLYEPGLEGSFRETEAYSPGEALDVFDIEGWRMGVMVCFDGNFPEVPRVLALKGAQVVLYPNGRNIVMQEAEAAARANNVVVLVANMVGSCGTDTGQGTSRIISPVEGESVALKGEQEGWIAKELRYSEVAGWQKPLAAPFRRPELYGVMTEGAARPPKGATLAPHNIVGPPGWTADGVAYTSAWNRIMNPATACQTPWACVGKDCGNWGTYARPPCRAPQQKLKLISLQLDCGGATKEERVVSALKLLERAADAEGQGVYVFPELALCPLPDAVASQEAVPGPITRRFGEVADKRGIWVAVGMSETSSDPKRPYNSVVVIGPHEQVFRYRKTHLCEAVGERAFREDQVFTPGDSLDVVDVKGWRMGVMVGQEANVPEVARVLSLKGAQVILHCSARKVVGTESELASASDVDIVVVANHVGDNGLEKGQGSSRIITPPQGMWAKPVWAPSGQEGWIAKEFYYSDMERWRNLQVLGRCPTIDPRSRRLDLYQILTAGAN